MCSEERIYRIEIESKVHVKTSPSRRDRKLGKCWRGSKQGCAYLLWVRPRKCTDVTTSAADAGRSLSLSLSLGRQCTSGCVERIWRTSTGSQLHCLHEKGICWICHGTYFCLLLHDSLLHWKKTFTAPVPQSIFVSSRGHTHPKKPLLPLQVYIQRACTNPSACTMYDVQFMQGGTRDRCVGQSIWTTCSVHARYTLYNLVLPPF